MKKKQSAFVYRSIKRYKYQLIAPHSYQVDIFPTIGIETEFLRLDQTGLLTIKKYYAWDGPSGPTFDTETFLRASLVHDALYQLIRTRQLRPNFRRSADRILKKICLEDGMSKFRAWYVFKAVRLFGGIWQKYA